VRGLGHSDPSLQANLNLQSIWSRGHNREVAWTVEIGDEFEPEFNALHEDVQDEILAAVSAVWAATGQTARGHSEWVAAREHEGASLQCGRWEWRVAFTFDAKRKAILLVAGDKSGVSEKRFYRELVRRADSRFDAHLVRLKRERK
jgi:hypothetical protein